MNPQAPTWAPTSSPGTAQIAGPRLAATSLANTPPSCHVYSHELYGDQHHNADWRYNECTCPPPVMPLGSQHMQLSHCETHATMFAISLRYQTQHHQQASPVPSPKQLSVTSTQRVPRWAVPNTINKPSSKPPTQEQLDNLKRLQESSGYVPRSHTSHLVASPGLVSRGGSETQGSSPSSDTLEDSVDDERLHFNNLIVGLRRNSGDREERLTPPTSPEEVTDNNTRSEKPVVMLGTNVKMEDTDTVVQTPEGMAMVEGGSISIISAASNTPMILMAEKDVEKVKEN